jgi:hypothetical protein
MDPTDIQVTEARGSCVCGAVSIKIDCSLSVIRAMSCHCRHCQKGAGGPFQTNALFNKEDIQVIDLGKALKSYLFPGDDVASGFPKEKWFCSVSWGTSIESSTFKTM